MLGLEMSAFFGYVQKGNGQQFFGYSGRKPRNEAGNHVCLIVNVRDDFLAAMIAP